MNRQQQKAMFAKRKITDKDVKIFWDKGLDSSMRLDELSLPFSRFTFEEAQNLAGKKWNDLPINMQKRVRPSLRSLLKEHVQDPTFNRRTGKFVISVN